LKGRYLLENPGVYGGIILKLILKIDCSGLQWIQQIYELMQQWTLEKTAMNVLIPR
jgi:hypothetical protein